MKFKKEDITYVQLLFCLSWNLIAIMITFNGILSALIASIPPALSFMLLDYYQLFSFLYLTKIKSLDKRIPLYLYSAGAIGVFTVVLII